MHHALYDKANKFLEESIVETNDKEKIISLVKEGKIVKTVFDGAKATDEVIKDETTGKTLVIPFEDDVPLKATCPFTGNQAKHVVYIAKSL